jgi:hypothetical protein
MGEDTERKVIKVDFDAARKAAAASSLEDFCGSLLAFFEEYPHVQISFDVREEGGGAHAILFSIKGAPKRELREFRRFFRWLALQHGYPEGTIEVLPSGPAPIPLRLLPGGKEDPESRG